jgi:predicted transcriptional regulator of viral defense system
MREAPLSKRVQRRIRAKREGAVFGAKDFLDLGSRAAVDQALSRLERSGFIRRVSRGIYDYPRRNERLGITLSPLTEEVVRAVAKRNASRIQVTGAEAANALGLSTQVPARIVYLTDGESRRLQLGGQVVEFRHTTPRNLATAGKVSGTVIQALRHLGREHVDESTVRHLQRVLSERDRERLRKDRIHAPAWMQPVLLEIAGGASGE